MFIARMYIAQESYLYVTRLCRSRLFIWNKKKNFFFSKKRKYVRWIDVRVLYAHKDFNYTVDRWIIIIIIIIATKAKRIHLI